MNDYMSLLYGWIKVFIKWLDGGLRYRYIAGAATLWKIAIHVTDCQVWRVTIYKYTLNVQHVRVYVCIKAVI